MRQVFQRDIHGGVAARDVINIDLSRCTEYEAQHFFHVYTRITCSRQARGQLTYLANDRDFEFPALRRAIGCGALIWSKETQRWRKASPFADYCAALAFLFCAVLFLLGGAGVVWTHLTESQAFIATLLSVAAFMFLLGGLQLQFVKPHRIALAAVQALDGMPAVPVAEGTAT